MLSGKLHIICSTTGNFLSRDGYLSLSLILLAIGTVFLLWVEYAHRKRGGLKGSADTIIFYRDGLYGIIRHPGVFGFMLWFICLPIFLSVYVPFTFLSAVAIIIAIVYYYYMISVEEKINVQKWGDEYRAYMKDVPRLIGIPKSKKTE